MQKGSFLLGKSSRISDIGLLGICFLSLVAGTLAKCPLQISPQSVVVKYGDSVSVNCNTSVTHQGMGWESTVGKVPQTKASLIIWSVSQLTDWDIQPPFCFINYNREQCEVALPITIYKTPDNVSISTVNQIMTEGDQYELQCDVHNVAPARNLTVKWYKGEKQVYQTSFTDTTKSPVNITSQLLIRPDRDDDGAQYRCEAELNLGEEGPQPPPTNTSEPLSIYVYFKPTINETKLPSVVSVVRGYSKVVVCEAEGNPKPIISWSYGTVNGENFTITEFTPENLTCTATNAVGSSSRSVKVVIQDFSISAVNYTEPMIEGNQYNLQCDIRNVAPAQSLTVNWYKGETLVKQTNFTNTIESPVNKTFILLIHPKRYDDGVQYKCEAELKPQNLTSKSVNITVNFKPVINETILPSMVPVFRGYPVNLSCIADGKPKPIISWKHKNEIIYREYLTITESTPEKVVCIANNSIEVVSREVKVILKEDYLPLIAGLIAITVAFISVIFIFIYSIYYKTAKMGRYSLKDAKPSEQNGNIAQNGKDNTIPMKKLSQSNILA